MTATRARTAISPALALAVALALALALAFGGVWPDPAAHATPGDDSTVHVTQVRDICHLPRPGNNGRVLGHDVGWSMRDGTTTFWFFGDTFVDTNRSGVALDGPNEFITGTIARSDDIDPTDCVELTYRASANGLARPVLKPQSRRECLIWPSGGVVVNGTVYFYYTSVRSDACIKDEPDGPIDQDQDETKTYAGGLAKLTNKTTMKAKRVGVFWPGGTGTGYFGTPVQAGGFVYVFGVRRATSGESKVVVGRVPEAKIESAGEYRYWNGSTWGTDPAAAVPIFTEAAGTGLDALGPMSIAYNAQIDRWIAISSCGYLGTRICARTMATKGTSAGALTREWNPASVLYDCPGVAFDCYHGAQHAAFASGSKIYVTNARWDGKPWARPQHYWVSLREIEIGAEPPPFSREHTTSEGSFLYDRVSRDFVLASEQGRDGWSYVSWPDRTPLTWDASLHAWWGGGTVDGGEPAPLVAPDTMRPSVGGHAARVWTAPAAGTIDIGGEAWLEQTCGDGTRLEILRSRAGVTTSLHLKTLDPRSTTSRGRLMRVTNLPVLAGDQIVFRVGPKSTDARCDTVFWSPSITVDYDHAVVRDAADDMRARTAQGFREWRYQTCTLDFVTESVSACVDMPTFVQAANGGYWLGAIYGYVTRHEIQPPFLGGIASRTWVAPAAGHVRLTGTVTDLQHGATCGLPDDGSTFAIYAGDVQVWPVTPAWAATAGRQYDFTIDRDIAAGTPLRFLVSPGAAGAAACDLTGLEARIDFTWE